MNATLNQQERWYGFPPVYGVPPPHYDQWSMRSMPPPPPKRPPPISRYNYPRKQHLMQSHDSPFKRKRDAFQEPNQKKRRGVNFYRIDDPTYPVVETEESRSLESLACFEQDGCPGVADKQDPVWQSPMFDVSQWLQVPAENAATAPTTKHSS